MKTIDLLEMQQIELNILLELDKVCRENGLRYYMDGGTLLGAVCYEGFIPWDDDIDLKMPRPDYERLLKLQDKFPDYIKIDAPRPAHCEYTFLKLVDDRTVLEEDCGNGQYKTTGIYIDILPMDGHPLDAATCEGHLAELSKLNTLFHLSQNHFESMKKSPSAKTRMKGVAYDAIYSPWKIYCKLTELAKKYSYDECSRVGLLIEGDPIRERFEKCWLEPAAELEFEGHMIPAPNNDEEHLTIFYRKPITRELYHHNLPKIASEHNHKVYWKE